MPPESTSQANRPTTSAAGTQTARAVREPEPFQPAAALLAVVFPGLGHFYLRQYHRGILVTAGVMGLYLTGLLIGGIQCVDRKDNYIWFLGQALAGPMTFGLDYVHQAHLKVYGPDARTGQEKWREPYPNETRDPATGKAVSIVPVGGVPTAKLADGRTISPAYPSYVKAVPRSNELGTLFTTVAGFLNVIVVIDAAFGRMMARKRAEAAGVVKTLRAPVIGGGA